MRVSSLFSTVLLAVTACAGGSAYVTGPGPGPSPDPDPLPIAVDPSAMPPHVFNAQPVPIKNRPAHVQPPDLSTLPELVRSNKCTRSTRRGGGAIAYQTKPSPKSKPPTTPVRPYADASAPAQKSADGKAGGSTRPYGNTPTTETPSAVAESAIGGDDAGFADEARTSSESQAPGKNNAAPADRREERKAKKAQRKAERAADKRPPAASSPVEDSAGAAYEPASEAEAPAYRTQAPHPVQPIEPVELNYPPAGQGWGDATYLSNDDTMSLSSAQRITYAIDAFLPLPLAHIRPHELLNYFSFETTPVESGHDFSVKAELATTPDDQGLHTLTVAIQGRPVNFQNRRNVALTLVVDRSGSMKEEGRMDYLKRGLQRMVSELKAGDVVNLVVFDERVCTPLQNFVVGRDDTQILRKAISSIRPQGNTDIHSALTRGYELADRTYLGPYSNRVLLITDALANTGVTDAHTMSLVADWYDSRRIRLSGVGVGREFNDDLLDQMTERGRGAYVFLGSKDEVDAVFGPNFLSLIETTANDVHFRLHLPPALRMYRFHGEESSTFKEDVQAIHYFANTSQLFLADLEAWEGRLRTEDWVMLEIEYGDPETGDELVEEYAFRIGDIARDGNNVKKARLVNHWVEALAAIAAQPPPNGWGPRAHGWADPYGARTCQDERARLDTMASGLDDPEVQRLLGLWDRYCLRYDRTDRPPRKDGGSGWPGARG